MSEKRSLIVFDKLYEAEQKFDYYVMGLTGALCVYIERGYTASKLDFNTSTFELFSILVLIASLWFGFRRIKLAIMIKKLNAHQLHLLEQHEELVRNFQEQALMNANIKDELTLINKHGNYNESIKKSQKEANSAYDWRNRLLFVGFAMLLMKKVLVAYI